MRQQIPYFKPNFWNLKKIKTKKSTQTDTFPDFFHPFTQPPKNKLI